jgi:hypothetical protein
MPLADGNQIAIEGVDAVGAAPSVNPALVGGTDGSAVRILLVDSSGRLQITTAEEATFVAFAANVAIGSNKSMMSILNGNGSAVRVRIQKVALRNSTTAAITGIAANFEFRRITGHSAGTDITSTGVEQHDTTQSLNGSVTVRTGATVSGEATKLLDEWRWSSDEWGPGTLDEEGAEHALQNLIPAWLPIDKTTPITLRANEGVTIKQTVNSTAGNFDVLVVFSVV